MLAPVRVTTPVQESYNIFAYVNAQQVKRKSKNKKKKESGTHQRGNDTHSAGTPREPSSRLRTTDNLAVLLVPRTAFEHKNAALVLSLTLATHE